MLSTQQKDQRMNELERRCYEPLKVRVYYFKHIQVVGQVLAFLECSVTNL